MLLTERSVELPWMVAHIGRPERILDIGSADGAYTALLFELCRDLTLCDTRQFTPTVPATVHIGSASDLPQAWTGTFDLVTCISVLDHVGLDAYGNTTDDGLIDAVLSEIERVTKHGGRLLLTVPFGRYQVTKHPGGGQRVFDEETLMGLFPETQWKVLSRQVWLMCGDHYEPCVPGGIVNAGYAEWRAEAVIALELVSL